MAWLLVCQTLLTAPPGGRRDVLCGAYSCYVALRTLGHSVGSFADFEKRLGPPSGPGYSLAALREACKSYGAHAECVRCSLDGMEAIEGPYVCVALLRRGHYVAMVAFDRLTVKYVDAADFLEIPRSAFEAR